MYDYVNEVTNALIEKIENDWPLPCIKDNYDCVDDFRDRLEWDYSDDDDVTGNASGSYTMNRARAQEYVLDNISLLYDAVKDGWVSTGDVGNYFIEEDWEVLDVILRMYVFNTALGNAMEELGIDDFFFDSEEDEADKSEDDDEV